MTVYRFTKGKLPKKNFLLPVTEATPKRGRKWETYIETWKRYDRNPNTRVNDYALWRRHYNRNYISDDASRYVKRKIELYKSIKENGFKYEGWIIKVYPAPYNFVDDGHTQISILRHLEPDAVVEVMGIDHPPPTGPRRYR